MTKRVFFCPLVLILTAGMHSGCRQRAETSITKDEKAVAEEPVAQTPESGVPLPRMGDSTPSVNRRGVYATGSEDKKTVSEDRNGRPASVEVSEEAALAIARRAAAGIAMPRDCPVHTELAEGKYIITFSIKKSIPAPGPDYYARITIDAKTGGVIQKLTSQ